MLKVGDKVKVTYSDGDQFLGRIVGETAKQWKVDFDGTGEKRVNKSTQVELVDDPKTETKEVIHYTRKEYKPSKRVRRNNVLIFLGIMAVMAALGYAVVHLVGVF